MQIIRGFLRRIVFLPASSGVTLPAPEVPAGPSAATGPALRRDGGR
jgi:hypothetical protein